MSKHSHLPSPAGPAGVENRAAQSHSNSTQACLRKASEADVAAIVEIETAAFLEPAERFNERKIRSLLRSHRTHVLVAERNGSVAGWGAGMAVMKGTRPWGRIYALAIHPSVRGQKLGAALARELISLMKERGAEVIVLEVRQGNERAFSLYRRLGFQPCHQLPDYYGKGLHAQRMVLDFSPLN
jgi:ribosomal-protein-alanine acetyltransferase